MIMNPRLNRKSENFVQNEFELTLRRFGMNFLDLIGFYKICRHLLQTIGSKRVANAKTMENNRSIVAREFAFKI